MGKTNSPLTIWVAPEWLDHPKIKELEAKGHIIENVLLHEPDAPHSDAPNPDLILHPNAWRWHDGQWGNLEVALKEARKGRPAKSTPKAGKQRSGGKGPKRAAKQ